MIVKFILFSLFISILLLMIPFFRKKGIKFLTFFMIVFFLSFIGFLVYLWNSSENYQELKYINSTSFKIQDVFNQPINNINATDLNNHKVKFEMKGNGVVIFYNVNNNEIVIIKAQGYESDTIQLKNHSLDTIYLKQINNNGEQ